MVLEDIFDRLRDGVCQKYTKTQLPISYLRRGIYIYLDQLVLASLNVNF